MTDTREPIVAPSSELGVAATSAPSEAERDPTCTVVISCYTEKRIDQTKAAVLSVRRQSYQPVEVILCVDHNDRLLYVLEEWAESLSRDDQPPVIVVPNQFEGRLGSARNTALLRASGDLIAFLDDDAEAEETWLERICAPLIADPDVVLVGGKPVPRYEADRPPWFPHQFNWVFGCHYLGLPESVGTVRHVIGAAMATRKDVLLAIGGFHSDNHDDMDLSHRSAALSPTAKVLYEPSAVVHHFVGADRLSWRYFWRRCLLVNFGKVRAFADMREAGGHMAELSFARGVLTTGLAGEVKAFRGGEHAALMRASAMVSGLALGGLGTAAGHLAYSMGRRPPVKTQGIGPDDRPSCEMK